MLEVASGCLLPAVQEGLCMGFFSLHWSLWFLKDRTLNHLEASCWLGRLGLSCVYALIGELISIRSLGEILLVTGQQWWVVTEDWSGMEGKKGLNWLEAGMLGHLASEWSFQVMREETASALSCSHSGMGTALGPRLGSRAGLGDGPTAGSSAPCWCSQDWCCRCKGEQGMCSQCLFAGSM